MKMLILFVAWWEIDKKGALHEKLLYYAAIKDERVRSMGISIILRITWAIECVLGHSGLE